MSTSIKRTLMGVVTMVAGLGLLAAFALPATAQKGLIGGKQVKPNSLGAKHIRGNSIGYGELRTAFQNRLNDIRDRLDALEEGSGTPGTPGRTTLGSSFSFRVDAPTANTTLYDGNGFDLDASCAGGGATVNLEATQDNIAYTQIGQNRTNTNTNGAFSDNLDIADPDENLTPGTVDDTVNTLVVRPVSGGRTVVTYSVENGESGDDCRVEGVAVLGS